MPMQLHAGRPWVRIRENQTTRRKVSIFYFNTCGQRVA